MPSRPDSSVAILACSFRFYRMAAGLFSEDAEEVAATQAAMPDSSTAFSRNTTNDRPGLVCQLDDQIPRRHRPGLSPLFL